MRREPLEPGDPLYGVTELARASADDLSAPYEATLGAIALTLIDIARSLRSLVEQNTAPPRIAYRSHPPPADDPPQTT